MGSVRRPRHPRSQTPGAAGGPGPRRGAGDPDHRGRPSRHRVLRLVGLSGGGPCALVPLEPGRHLVERLPHARLEVIDGESHLGGLGIAREVIDAMMRLGPRSTPRGAARRAPAAR